MTLVQSEFQTFLDRLEEALKGLPPRFQLVFGAACCERHFGSYLHFRQEQHWGSPELLRSAIDTAWAICESGATITPTGMAELLAECMKAIPDSNQFSTPSADYAQNLAIMVAHLVEFMEANDPRKIVIVASLARDLVDAKVQISEGLKPTDPDLERKIANHPLMRAELDSQRKSLERLSHIRGDHGEFRRSAVFW